MKGKSRRRAKRNDTDLEKYLVVAIVAAAILLIAISDTLHTRSSTRIPASNNEFPVNEFPMTNEMPQSYYHVHADFLVVISGKQVDFNKPAYDFVDPAIHLHILNYKGDRVLHIEERGVVLDDFFYSIEMGLNVTCFNNGLNEYCTNATHSLRLYVNGQQNSDFGNYELHDLDRILVTYGNETRTGIDKQLESVTSVACVFSQKCQVPSEAENKIFYN